MKGFRKTIAFMLCTMLLMNICAAAGGGITDTDTILDNQEIQPEGETASGLSSINAQVNSVSTVSADVLADKTKYGLIQTVEEYQAASPEQRKLDLLDGSGISNEDFYGKYNKFTGAWDKPGYINYDYVDPNIDNRFLVAAKNAAMESDYDGASKAMQENFRLRAEFQNAAQVVGTLTKSDYIKGMLTGKNIYDGISAVQDVISVKKESEISTIEDEKIELDVTTGANAQYQASALTGKIAMFMGGINKDGTSIRVRSKEYMAGKYAPRLIATVNGVQQIITPSEDTYVSPAQTTATPYGGMDDLMVEESVSSIGKDVSYDENTKQTIIIFDLTPLGPAEKITNIKFECYASNVGNAGSGMMLIGYDSYQVGIDEDTEYWFITNYRRGYINYQGVDFITFCSPTGVTDKYYKVNSANQFYGYQPLNKLCHLDKTNSEFYQYTFLKLVLNWLYQDKDIIKYNVTNTTLGNATRMQGYVPYFLTTFIQSDLLTVDIFNFLYKYVWMYGDRLRTLEFTYNNLGIQQCGAMIAMLSNFPEFRDCDSWRQKLNVEIVNMVNNQVYPDGSGLEGALGYAIYAMEAFRNWNTITDAAKVPSVLSEEVMEAAQKVLHYVIDMSGPGFQGNSKGDGSYGNFNINRNWAELLQDPIILYGATKGKEGQIPDHTSIFYPYTNRLVMRNGWGANDLYLYTDVDGRTGSHNHSDDLSIMLYGYGSRLLDDMSTSGYVQGEVRLWHEGVKAHNTIVINDTERTDGTIGQTLAWETNGSYDFSRQKTNSTPGYYYDRSILFVKPGFWIASDYVKPDAANAAKINTYSQNWHTLPLANLSIDEAGIMHTNFTDGANIQVAPNQSEKYSDIKINPQGYYAGIPASYVQMQQKTKGTATFDTVLYPENIGEKFQVVTKNIPLNDVENNAASAMTVSVKNNNTVKNNATYYIVHEKSEIKPRNVGNYNFDGSLFYVDETRNANKIILQNTSDAGMPMTLNYTDGTAIFKSLEKIHQIGIEQSGSLLQINTSEEIDLSKITVKKLGDSVKTVKLNGKQVNFNTSANYIYFGDAPIIEDPDGNTPKQPSTDPVIRHGGGSSGGGSVIAPVDPVTPVETPSEDNTDPLIGELKNHWAEKEISYLIQKGIIKGATDGLDLKSSVTRGEFAALISRALQLETASYQNRFADVSPDAWYANDIQAVTDANLMVGDGELMHPDERITRQEMAKIVILALEKTGHNSTVDKTEANFADQAEISDWAVPYVQAGVSLGIMKGFEGNLFMPNAPLLREQAMVMIYRIITMPE